MSKVVYIIHGWEASPRDPMLVWLKKELEKKGFEVNVPEMPNPPEPKIDEWVDKLKKEVKRLDKETYFIGHSIGCQGILRYLETLREGTKIGGVVLIAPWTHLNEETIEEEGEEVKELAKPWLNTPIDWEKIRKLTSNFVCMFSDNDYYVPFSEKEIFEKKLGAKIIVEHEKGHFARGDGVKDNPTALKEILRISG